MVPSNVTATLNHDCTGIHQLLPKPGKESVENKETAGEQEVNMPPLRHTLAGGWLARDDVLFDQCDLLKVIGESASSEEARHTGTGNDRMAYSDTRHGLSPTKRKTRSHHPNIRSLARRPNHEGAASFTL